MFLLQALGSNGSGQLGIGHKEDVSTPQPVLLPASLTLPTTTTTTTTQPPELRRIVAGGNHTLLVLSSGDLLSSGDHTTGACGRRVVAVAAAAIDTTTHEKQTPPTPEFRPVDLSPLPEGSRKVKHVAATWAASVVVANDGGGATLDKVYSFGSGDKGELGLGAGTARALEPTQIPDFPPAGTRVVDIAACMGHVVAVLSNGEAWGWGNGRKGQLGEPAGGAVCSPRRIEGVGFRVVRAVCGREFTCLFGESETGEMVVLGSDKWGVRSQAPESVAGWKEVGAGWGSVFVLKEDGTLLSWGRNDHGQLAREGLGRVRRIAVGSEHALALTEAGDLMVWGWGEHGNCGPIRDNNGEKGQQNRIASIEQGMDITMIGAGCATSWIAIDKPT
ncbi:regulator of chromosome condensation 1/beta-lactamase-inhibitor protein II [Chaetomidium leptoderma]|uniref:Regulator of chromosome condensation 1/beta-lactamase-inhibitor protein II n=1 Tax=Chaetomidium leptoderma TaxID=669021 RepID=A0AAN6VKK6_9PEZI|nr:regulator of chromosome condensation 1/beta-lactamase-inhibitor protein II [Chaetomidium leptoderma]